MVYKFSRNIRLLAADTVLNYGGMCRAQRHTFYAVAHPKDTVSRARQRLHRVLPKNQKRDFDTACMLLTAIKGDPD